MVEMPGLFQYRSTTSNKPIDYNYNQKNESLFNNVKKQAENLVKLYPDYKENIIASINNTVKSIDESNTLFNFGIGELSKGELETIQNSLTKLEQLIPKAIRLVNLAPNYKDKIMALINSTVQHINKYKNVDLFQGEIGTFSANELDKAIKILTKLENYLATKDFNKNSKFSESELRAIQSSLVNLVNETKFQQSEIDNYKEKVSNIREIIENLIDEDLIKDPNLLLEFEISQSDEDYDPIKRKELFDRISTSIGRNFATFMDKLIDLLDNKIQKNIRTLPAVKNFIEKSKNLTLPKGPNSQLPDILDNINNILCDLSYDTDIYLSKTTKALTEDDIDHALKSDKRILEEDKSNLEQVGLNLYDNLILTTNNFFAKPDKNGITTEQTENEIFKDRLLKTLNHLGFHSPDNPSMELDAKLAYCMKQFETEYKTKILEEYRAENNIANINFDEIKVDWNKSDILITIIDKISTDEKNKLIEEKNKQTTKLKAYIKVLSTLLPKEKEIPGNFSTLINEKEKNDKLKIEEQAKMEAKAKAAYELATSKIEKKANPVKEDKEIRLMVQKNSKSINFIAKKLKDEYFLDSMPIETITLAMEMQIYYGPNNKNHGKNIEVQLNPRKLGELVQLFKDRGISENKTQKTSKEVRSNSLKELTSKNPDMLNDAIFIMNSTKDIPTSFLKLVRQTESSGQTDPKNYLSRATGELQITPDFAKDNTISNPHNMQEALPKVVAFFQKELEVIKSIKKEFIKKDKEFPFDEKSLLYLAYNQGEAGLRFMLDHLDYKLKDLNQINKPYCGSIIEGKNIATNMWNNRPKPLKENDQFIGKDREKNFTPKDFINAYTIHLANKKIELAEVEKRQNKKAT